VDDHVIALGKQSRQSLTASGGSSARLDTPPAVRSAGVRVREYPATVPQLQLVGLGWNPVSVWMVIVIRVAAESDERDLAEFDESIQSPLHSAVLQSEERTNLAAHRRLQGVIVAVQDRSVIGYVKLDVPSDLQPIGRYFRLVGLVVALELQRQGVGYRLVTAATHVARGQGASHLTVSVLRNNSAALSLFSVCGFQVDRTKTTDSHEGRFTDVVEMRLPLTQKWFRRYLNRPGPGGSGLLGH
jgi:ribosomal protein S18 acetylase RimI-like enzyme